jgi:hypothetical protein
MHLAILDGIQGRSDANKFEYRAKECDPMLMEDVQPTEEEHWLRKFLLPDMKGDLKLTVFEPFLEHVARGFMHNNVTLCIKRKV